MKANVTQLGVESARAVLKQAEATFLSYAAHHKAKADEAASVPAPHAATVDALREKQNRNATMAALCREAWETGLMDVTPLEIANLPGASEK